MNPAPVLREEADDIQAMVSTGFGWLHESEFCLLEIDDAGRACEWLRTLLDGPWVRSAGGLAKTPDRKDKVAQVAAIAFSHAGLLKLGLMETGDFPFSTPFRSGMGSPLRMELLRDSPRDQWGWSDHTAHVLFAKWWKSTTTPAFPVPDGFKLLRAVKGSASSFDDHGALTEPFGFREGVSQPKIRGLKGEEADPGSGERPAAKDWDHWIAPGEFIMGYRNEYDELSYCANVEGWDCKKLGAHFALNGSFLAVRQIEQDVAAFNELKEAAQLAGCPAIGEKMMGRHYDGRPLHKTDGIPRGLSGAKLDEFLNRFRYRVDDENGFVTPRGAHIRRANPRDMLGHDVESGILSSKLHRLLRRGRPYADGDRQGTFFIACNADLERQFEFVFQRWLRNPRFADLDREDDPFVGGVAADSKGVRRFTMQGLPTGRRLSIEALTTTLGGGYFFLPGLKALRFIAGLASSRP